MLLMPWPINPAVEGGFTIIDHRRNRDGAEGAGTLSGPAGVARPVCQPGRASSRRQAVAAGCGGCPRPLSAAHPRCQRRGSSPREVRFGPRVRSSRKLNPWQITA